MKKKVNYDFYYYFTLGSDACVELEVSSVQELDSSSIRCVTIGWIEMEK